MCFRIYSNTIIFIYSFLHTIQKILHGSFISRHWNCAKHFNKPAKWLNRYIFRVNNQKVSFWINCNTWNKCICKNLSMICIKKISCILTFSKFIFSFKFNSKLNLELPMNTYPIMYNVYIYIFHQ